MITCDDMFTKRLCRLCETGEHHTTGDGKDADSCTYWIERDENKAPHLKGYVKLAGYAREFWVPMFKCPWCGKEL